MDDETVLAFVRGAIKSGWSLEVLLLLARAPEVPWTADALVRELRGSVGLVAESLANLQAAALIEVAGETVRYHPQTAEQAHVVAALIDLHARKPVTVMQAIFSSPGDKIRSFSDAFLFRKK